MFFRPALSVSEIMRITKIISLRVAESFSAFPAELSTGQLKAATDLNEPRRRGFVHVQNRGVINDV
jgi:hypothetical protein